MKRRYIVISMAVAGLISGCDNSGTRQKAGTDPAQQKASQPAYLVDFPAVPVIENAIRMLSPQLSARFDLPAMQKVCALARGILTPGQVKTLLEKEGVDISSIAATDPLAMLVNNDEARRQHVCAAYIANTVLSYPDVAEFTVRAVSDAKTADKPEVRINNDALIKALATKTAVARANAELFALIALELQKKPGLTLEQYTREAQKDFNALAPFLLKRVKELYSEQPDGYQLTQMTAQHFTFHTNGGYIFDYGQNGLSLTYKGVAWYGQEALFGKNYTLPVSYFSADTLALLGSKKKE